MSNIDKQALREEFQLMQDNYSDPADRERQVIYIAAEALLDELDAAEKLATQQGNIAAALLDEVTTLRRNADDKAPELRTQLIEADNELEALRQRIAELEARKVTVKLPADYRNSDGSINADMFNTCAVVGAFRDALAAAGIGVKGE